MTIHKYLCKTQSTLTLCKISIFNLLMRLSIHYLDIQNQLYYIYNPKSLFIEMSVIPEIVKSYNG